MSCAHAYDVKWRLVKKRRRDKLCLCIWVWISALSRSVPARDVQGSHVLYSDCQLKAVSVDERLGDFREFHVNFEEELQEFRYR